jgi:hypothetical protein
VKGTCCGRRFIAVTSDFLTREMPVEDEGRLRAACS